jgi:hypothetical protein
MEYSCGEKQAEKTGHCDSAVLTSQGADLAAKETTRIMKALR